MPRSPWVNVEIRPSEPPTIQRCRPFDGPEYFDVWWPRSGLSVQLTAAELDELVSRALVAKAEVREAAAA